MSFKFVHAADLHLDSPLRARAAGSLQPVFERATFTAFRRIVDLCLAERVEFLLLAGDLFEFRDRSVRAQLELRRELGRLDAVSIPTFIVHGNHDPLSCDPGTLRLFESVKVFGASWEEVELRRGGAVWCRIQGISYPQERVAQDLTPLFARQGPEFTIGLLHANLGGSPGHANYAPCSVSDLDRAALDYWALGHVHTRAEYRLHNGGLAVYPGNPQGRHIAEPGERGCVLVEVKDGRAFPRFCPLESVRWSRVEIDIGPIDALDLLAEEICQRVAAAATSGPDAHAIAVRLVGSGPLHFEIRRPGSPGELLEHLCPAALQRSPPVLLESIEDCTRPELDLRTATAPGTLGEAIASVARTAQSNPTALGQLCADEGLLKVQAVLRRAGARPSPEAAMIERAMLRALELLECEVEP